MDVKKLALLVGALVIAVVTAIMAKNMFAGAGAQQAAAAPAVPVGPKVLVAKKALPVGTIIDADSFTFQPWPKELMQSAYYIEGSPDGDPAEPARHRSFAIRSRPASRSLAARSSARRIAASSPRRWRRNARHHRSRERLVRRCRLRLPGRPCRSRADRSRSRAAATVRRSRFPKRSSATSGSSRPTSASTTRTRTARHQSRPSPT